MWGFDICNFETPGFATLLDISIRGIQQVQAFLTYIIQMAS